MSEFTEQQREIEALKRLELMADKFKSQVGGVYWQAWNGHGRSVRATNLQTLKHMLAEMDGVISRAIEHEEKSHQAMLYADDTDATP